MQDSGLLSVEPGSISQAREAINQTMALVLAGGRGSRLMQLTANRAKPAVHFGGKFRIIDFALSNCINSGVRRVGVVTSTSPTACCATCRRAGPSCVTR